MKHDAPPALQKRKRIFFLGAHKLLVRTELQRLRDLGYEVFNPPYLSHIPDQSAIKKWEPDPHSTLPESVQRTLSRSNFFYTPVPEDVKSLFNKYFDAVVVTIVARWAVEMLRVFDGPVVFRTYGQTSTISEDLHSIGARRIIEEHPGFQFCPHAQETLDYEEDWLKRRATVIPYCLDDEVFTLKGSWTREQTRSGEILITAPNILANVFHKSHYQYVKEYFYAPYFRLCGVQLKPVDDPQVVHTLPRQEQLRMFRQASGYLYTYNDPRVCYLPPIEMMVFGGPVLYFPGCLLAAKVGHGAPGEVKGPIEAQRRCQALRDGDSSFAEEVIASQTHVKDRYDPATVWPIFDKEMQSFLGPPQGDGKAGLGEPGGTLDEPALAGFLSAFLEGAVFNEMLDEQAAQPLLDSLLTGFPEASAQSLNKNILTEELCNNGSAAVLRAAMQASSVPTHALYGAISGMTDDSAVARTIPGKREVLHGQALTHIGRWKYIAGKPALTSRVGDVGMLHFGPYLRLPVGSYVVHFRIRATAPAVWDESQVLANLDIFSSGSSLKQKAVLPLYHDFADVALPFEVETADQPLEFRVFSNGLADIALQSISLEGAALSGR